MEKLLHSLTIRSEVGDKYRVHNKRTQHNTSSTEGGLGYRAESITDPDCSNKKKLYLVNNSIYSQKKRGIYNSI